MPDFILEKSGIFIYELVSDLLIKSLKRILREKESGATSVSLETFKFWAKIWAKIIRFCGEPNNHLYFHYYAYEMEIMSVLNTYLVKLESKPQR